MAQLPKFPYFIIEANRDYTVIDQAKNEDFGKLVKTPKSELPEVPRGAMQNPHLHHTVDMLYDTYHDENGRERKKFRDEVVLARSDERGRIMIPVDNPNLCRRVLRELRNLDPTVKLDPMGAMLPEEVPEEERKPINRGGRPRKSDRPFE